MSLTTPTTSRHGTPRVGADALADGVGRLAPQLAREVLRHHRDRPQPVGVGPGEVAARDQRSADRLHVAGRDELEQPDRRHLRLACRCGPPRTADRASPGPTSVTVDAIATDDTPGTAAILSRIAWCIRTTASGSFTCESGIDSRTVCTSLRAREPGMDVSQRLERADHQARADQEHQRQRDLRDDQHVARAMTLLLALAVRPPPRSMTASWVPRVLEHRDEPNSRPGQRPTRPA